MACNEDFVFGHGRDELLTRMYDVISGFDDTIPSHLVAGVLWLDDQAGLRRADDYVLITPGLAMWLPMEVTVVDAKIRAAIETEDNDTFTRLTVEQRFEVKFESPEGDEYTALLPEYIRGKTVCVRIMNEREASKLSFIYTVRANGELILLPNFVSDLLDVVPRTVHEL